jgi:hypothetical protein
VQPPTPATTIPRRHLGPRSAAPITCILASSPSGGQRDGREQDNECNGADEVREPLTQPRLSRSATASATPPTASTKPTNAASHVSRAIWTPSDDLPMNPTSTHLDRTLRCSGGQEEQGHFDRLRSY